jgi:Ca2+-transporting ATPase
MITGDHKLTAQAIAAETGIFTQGSMCVTGAELDKMTDEKLDSIIDHCTVFARVTPEHKLRIVRAFRRRGHICAMTGDGVNDAPAVKEADIGVSMGISGTEVTKQAAELILLDVEVFDIFLIALMLSEKTQDAHCVVELWIVFETASQSR